MKKVDYDPQTLRRLALDHNTSCRAAAKQLGMSVSSFFLRRKELGLPDRHRTPRGSKDGVGIRHDIPEANLRQLLLVEKLTQDQVCTQLACSKNKLRRLMRLYGIPSERTGPRSGAGHYHSWKGGRNLDKDGYWQVYRPDHPHARKGTYVLEHRLVMEVHLGRYLTPKEVVHHRDDNPQNNSIENLELFACNADHLRHELTGKPYAGSPRARAHRHRRKAPGGDASRQGSENGVLPLPSVALTTSEPQT